MNVENVTEGAITRFGEKLGHKLKHIVIQEEDTSLENQQILLNICPNITSIESEYFLSLNVIAYKHLKKLILIHMHLWSDTEIQAFGRFVDTNDNKLIHLVIITDIDIYQHLDDILRHVCRMTKLKLLTFADKNRKPIRILTQGFKDLAFVCKKMKKVILFVTIDNFYLWQTFRHFDALKELFISCIFGFGSILIDTKTKIRQLLTLKKLHIKCRSIGDYFFSDITQFSPNLEDLNLSVQRPRYQLSNQHLIALSECKLMQNLMIEFPSITIQNNIEYPIVNDIGLIPLIDNCKQLKRIELVFEFNSIIDSLIKWIEISSDSTKRKIVFRNCMFFSNEHIERVLSDMSRLENIESLKVLNYSEIIDVKFDKSMTISVSISAEDYFNERTDVWQTLCRYRDLKRLEFRVPIGNSDESMTNIEPLIKLKEITFKCQTINQHFFDNITKLAPNVEELELKSQFKLTNDDLITISQLDKLTKIELISKEKKYHSADDIGVNELLDNCQELRQVILDLEVNITSVSIDKLKEFANRIINSERAKEMIRFECFVISPELQSNRLKSLPKNLIIQTKLLINK